MGCSSVWPVSFPIFVLPKISHDVFRCSVFPEPRGSSPHPRSSLQVPMRPRGRHGHLSAPLEMSDVLLHSPCPAGPGALCHHLRHSLCPPDSLGGSPWSLAGRRAGSWVHAGWRLSVHLLPSLESCRLCSLKALEHHTLSPGEPSAQQMHPSAPERSPHRWSLPF